MALVADRFAVLDDMNAGRAIDLATGRTVTLDDSSAGGTTEQAQWTARCDHFLRWRHPSAASLVDFGVVGEMRRFEAWDDRDASEVLPRPDARTVPFLPEPGIVLVPRRAVDRIAEVIAQPTDGRPRFLALWGQPGAGVRTAVLALSRVARLHGFVPIRPAGIPSCESRWRKSLEGRSLFVVVDDEGGRGWGRALDWVLRNPMPHIVLFAGRREMPNVEGLCLDPVSVDDLVRAVYPAVDGPDQQRFLETAAERAKGNPARFTELLWRSNGAARARVVSRAAESVAIYGDVAHRPSSPAPRAPAVWPLSAELQALRRRVDTAAELLERGRHEPGCRALRQAIGGLVRRHEWEAAARGGLILAGALAHRGRPREAYAACEDARTWIARVDPGTPLWLEAAILSGGIATDLARLEESERILTAAVTAGRAGFAASHEPRARLALARCLFWRARYDEAYQTIVERQGVATEQHGTLTEVLSEIALVRIAIGRGDAGAALSKAGTAMDLARRQGAPAGIARAACASALAYASIGDRPAMERNIAACVAAARQAHDPMCALKARLIDAELACRTGSTRTAAALVARMSRLGSGIPCTVRARLALVAELAASSVQRRDAITRHAAAAGLPALALYAEGLTPASEPADRMAVNDALEMLHCCQVAEDAGELLTHAVSNLRARLGAASVACVSPQGVTIAADGGRLEPQFAERVLAVGQAIPPHQCDGCVQGGAPVRYGGDVIGALVARWTIGTLREPSRVSLALPLAATIIGPAVAEWLARARQEPSRALGDIVGVSAGIDDVRRAIERAAPAPFPVLVEGESGSGKELVARALHRHGPRRDRPFSIVNCAAMPDDLLESELFGHARGAFTGAISERPGVFEEAHTGTLFLDEVGELSPRAQAKLLRAIQEGEVRRLGENIARHVDVRLVAATNRDLRAEAAAGRFRRDLLYRLDVVRIVVPPLRDRREDIVVLAGRFWREATDRLGSKATLSSATLAAIAAYDWPGNVRELQNVLAALAVRSPRRGVIPPSALPSSFLRLPTNDMCRLDAARRAFEERFVRAALVRTAGHRIRAAAELGVTRQGLGKLMTRLGISDAL